MDLNNAEFYSTLDVGIKDMVSKIQEHDAKLERSELTKVRYHLEQAIMWLEVRRVCDSEETKSN